MRLAFLTDVHVANHRKFGGEVKAGINERANQCLWTLHRACEVVAKEDCDALFILGDLFDGTRPEPQIIAAVGDALSEACCTTYALRGNHEMVSAESGDHSLGPLALGDQVRVIDETTVVREEGWPAEVICVPYLTANFSERLPGILKNACAQGDRKEGSPPASPTRLLALHAGISDEKTEAWLRGAHDSIEASALCDAMRDNAVDVALAGHWHQHRAWEFAAAVGDEVAVRRVVQVGALCPTGFNNPGASGYGVVAFWDSAKPSAIRYVEVAGPRFLIVPQDEAVGTDRVVERLSKEGCKVFVKLQPAEEDVPKAQAWAARLKHDLAGVEVEPDQQDAEVAARAAASVARSADTLAEALTAFVKEMPLPEGVDRAAVLTAARSYLERGG